MSRSAYFRSLRGVLIAGVMLSLLLVAPAAFNWASRGGRQNQVLTESGGAHMDEVAVEKWRRRNPPLNATARPEGLTPFGKGFKAAEARDPRGLISTNIGHINLKKNDALNRVPAEFRASGPGVRANG
ncbi:MAG TPA: hypothetical protein VGV60_09310, partial [Candidatus Polarisedimenticolia bacterium]|nr:hypothetical protein [Candidatus Polarisedimenticolia bacterium]